jgi:hypothetical protein
MPFDAKRSVDDQGRPASMADPSGLSGSPVWSIEQVPTAYFMARLVGVLIEHRKRQRVLVATDVGAILALLRNPQIPGSPIVEMDWPLRPGE